MSMRNITQYPYATASRELGQVTMPPDEDLDLCRILDNRGAPAIKLWQSAEREMFNADMSAYRNKAGDEILQRRETSASGSPYFNLTNYNGSPAVDSEGVSFGNWDNSYSEFTIAGFFIPAEGSANSSGDFLWADRIEEDLAKTSVRIRKSDGEIEVMANRNVRIRENCYGEENIVVMTYSPERGVALYKNRGLGGGDESLILPAGELPFSFLSRSNSGTAFKGLSGSCVFMNVDLSRPERERDFDRLWSYFENKYIPS